MHSLRTRLSISLLALLVVALAYACSSSNPYSPTTPTPAPPAGSGSSNPADVTITIAGMYGDQSYSSVSVAVKAGQTVAWKNADSVTHTATADGGAFNTGSISPGATSTPITMATAGAFNYHCAIHPSMTGSLTVQ
jgi:plastocyanin